MKRGTVCRCAKCGGEYTYKGGRHNDLCPRCYREKRMRRVVEGRKMMPDKKSDARKCAARKKCAQKQESGKRAVIQGNAIEPGKEKISRKKLAELMKDPVCRLVHELELLNRERAERGLPPLSYGKYVQEYKR